MDLYNLKFVYVYFFIQFLAIIINSIIFLGLLVLCFIINALMHDMPRTFNDMLPFYLWSSFIIILYIASALPKVFVNGYILFMSKIVFVIKVLPG